MAQVLHVLLAVRLMRDQRKEEAVPCANTSSTQKAIACLPHGAIVVNAARGGMVVDEDLMAALKRGQVAAVGLDTYEGEPKLDPGYLSLENTLLQPYIGAATIETRTAMGMLALDNIDAVLGGRPAPSLAT